MEDEKTPVMPVETDEVQEDGGSNSGNGSTASHSSEEFVKVNQDDASLDEGAGDIPREDVEEVPPPVEESPIETEHKLVDKLDPRKLEKDLSAMSCEKELPEQENLSPENEQQSFEPEAESLPLVLEDDKYEDEEDQEVVAEDTPAQDEEIEQISPPLDEPDVKEEVIPVVQVQGVEEIETKPAPVSLVSNVPVAVVDLVYWRDIKKTAFIFSFLLLILGSLVCFSVISVFAYAGLAFLTVTVAFRLYKLVLQTLNGTQQPHPFQVLLDLDLTLSQDHVQKYISTILCHLNCGVTAARNLFLVQNTISSLKFGVFLWLLTYIGSCFNGLTVLIIDVILVFTLPPVYEKYQTQIDNYCGIARKKVCELMATAKAKLPGAKKQPKEKAQ